MREAPIDVSGALAAFAVAPHQGPAFVEACARAHELYVRASAVRPAADVLDGFASAPMRRALALGTALAADPALADGAATLAAALVMAGAHETGEASTVAAIAVGREVERRIVAAIADDAFARVWDVAAVGGRLGAVVAAARLGSLTAGAARHALGLAATQAAGTAAERGTPAGALALGKAAADALEAVALARHGFTAPAFPLEGRRGLAALMADRFDPETILDGLGRRWS